MKKHITLLSTVLLIAMGTAAQTNTNDSINRMVLVESTYNPIIAGAVKRNFIPEEMEPSMKKETIVYADESLPISRFARTPRMIESSTIANNTNYPGYLHLGFGNYSNLDGLAAYSLRIKEHHALTLGAHANGWNGYINTGNNSKWHSNLHDMGLKADYHLLMGRTELTAGVNGAYYSYNYLKNPPSTDVFDWQQGMRLGANIGIKGNIKEHYRYHAVAEYDHFGRSAHFAKEQQHSQGHLHTEASFGIDFYEYGIASLLVHSDLLLYQGIDYHNYLSLGITPTWEYSHEDLHFTIGANLDFQGKSHGPLIQMSPACKVSYIPSKLFSADLILDGNRQIHSFGSFYTLSPYWASRHQLTSSYTFLNACLQGNLRIMEGLHLHLGGGYRITNNALFENTLDTLNMVYTGLTTHDAQAAYGNARIDYTYKDWVSVTAEGTYNHWMVSGNRSILTRTPQFDANFGTRVRIINGLYIHTDCHFVMFNAVNGERERAIVDWSLGAHYAINDKLSFFLDGHNLLNRHYERYAGYPVQGINAMLGAAFKF